MRRFASMAAATLLLGACTVPAPYSPAGSARVPSEHVGLWHSEAAVVEEHDSRGDAMISMTADGRFSSAFRICTAEGIRTSTETGIWSVRGDLETATTQTVDGEPMPLSAYYIERYRVTWIDADTLDKTSEKNGETYRSRRVPPDFKPPPITCPR